MLWSDESTFQFVFGENGHQIVSPNDKSDHPDFNQLQKQKQTFVIVYGCISANGMVDLHMCEGTIDMEAYIGIVYCHQDVLVVKKSTLFCSIQCYTQNETIPKKKVKHGRLFI